jgi:hypothetical protein
MRSRKAKKVRTVRASPPVLEWLEDRCQPSALSWTAPAFAAPSSDGNTYQAEHADSAW